MALSDFGYTSLFTFFSCHKSFHSCFTFFPKFFIQCIHNSSLLKFFDWNLPQKYTFSSKPPRKSQQICKLSANYQQIPRI